MMFKDLLLLIVSVVLLILVVYITCSRKAPEKYDGTLNIDTSDPERDLYTIIIHEALDNIQKKKSVKLEVKISHKKHSL